MEGKKKKKQQHKNIEESGNVKYLSVSPLKALIYHLLCGGGLGLAFWVTHRIYSLDLITNPSQSLCLISVFVAPVAILLYSHLRYDRNQSYVKAVGRGLVALPAGAVANAAGAIILGAPVGFEYFPKTLSWSLLMSLLTFVPAACVFGSSWTDWHRIFSGTKGHGSTDWMICLPAHGAVIGAWFGAWPMPLDWESPWQEWPICVTYGAIAGYLVGLVSSLGCIFFHNNQQYLKEDFCSSFGSDCHRKHGSENNGPSKDELLQKIEEVKTRALDR